MAPHPRLVEFFNAVRKRLIAGYEGSAGMSSASKGSLREHGVRDALDPILPPMARIETGDIIDPFGGQSGQLDGVLIDHRAPTLKHAEDRPAFILAEGVIAVLESKSDVAGQWNEVKSCRRSARGDRCRCVRAEYMAR